MYNYITCIELFLFLMLLSYSNENKGRHIGILASISMYNKDITMIHTRARERNQ